MHSNGAPRRVDGRSLTSIHRPATAQDIADILHDADNVKRPLIPIGGGTKLSLGNAPDAVDDGIDLTEIDRVLHFEPADLTLSVEAGARFSHVQRTLAERGQTIPVETPEADRSTIGGLIATALAGPACLGGGNLRDLLIGISVAYPAGFIAKAGGLVVKNVTGFDLMRLHHGALGTLGVIVSANFKTVPLHRSETTVVASYGDFDAAFEAADRIRASRVRPLALEIIRSSAGYDTAVRIVGRPATVELLASETRAMLSADSKTFLETDSANWWQGYVEDLALSRTDRVLIRCGAAPRETARIAAWVEAQLAERALSVDWLRASPGLGSVIFGFPSSDLTATSLAGLQTGLLKACAHVTVLSAPPHLKDGLDVWGRLPETFAVMRALKAEYDPNRILNPGRMVGRI